MGAGGGPGCSVAEIEMKNPRYLVQENGGMFEPNRVIGRFNTYERALREFNKGLGGRQLIDTTLPPGERLVDHRLV